MKRNGSLLRMVDANANRAAEGLRVCEDTVRFCLEDAPSMRRLRRLRHGLASGVTGLGIPKARLLASRESVHDSGRAASSGPLKSIDQLLIVNFQRVKESLRVLEECARVMAPSKRANFQKLRFSVYGVERDLLIRLATVRHPRSRRRQRA